MRKTTNFNISVPELGDRPDITQVSDAIEDLENALAGTLEAMSASINGSVLALTSLPRTTKRTRYYDGMSIGFIAPSAIAPDTITTATVDGLPAQTISIPFLVNAGEEIFIHYNSTGFTASMFSVPKSNSVTSEATNVCATSKAVKIAYDKASEAKDQSDAKVSKTGDTMTGNLTLNASKVVIKGNNSECFRNEDDDLGMYAYFGGGGSEQSRSGYFGVRSKKAEEGELDSYIRLDVHGNFSFRSPNSGSLLKVYHEGQKPSPADIGAVSDNNGVVSNSLKVRGLIVANMYPVSNNRAAITMDKPGPNSFGIGAMGSPDHIRYGKVDGMETGNWIGAGLTHYFYGKTRATDGVASDNPDIITYGTSRKGVYANATLLGFQREDAGWLFYSDNSGNCTATGNLTAYSDIKLKKDLEIIPDAIGKIQALNGYTYTRKDTGERQTGVVAQEVQKVLPEAVHVSKAKEGAEDQTDTLTVAYGNMVGLLIEGIKEQQVTILSLEERIARLERLLEVK